MKKYQKSNWNEKKYKKKIITIYLYYMGKHILNFILGSLTTWECDNGRVGEEIRELQDYLIEYLTTNDNFLLEVILMYILITKENELLGRKIRTFKQDIIDELNDK